METGRRLPLCQTRIHHGLLGWHGWRNIL